jgi:hypothetical protein
MSSFIIFVAKCLSAQYRRRLSHAALHERLANAIYPLELEIKVTTRTGIDGKLYTPLDVWIVTCPSPNSVRTVRDYINGTSTAWLGSPGGRFRLAGWQTKGNPDRLAVTHNT